MVQKGVFVACYRFAIDSDSTHRSKIAAAQEMEMKMQDGLSCAGAVIGQQPVAVYDSKLNGQFLRDGRDFLDERHIFGSNALQIADFLFRQNQNVDRRSRMDVFDRQNPLVFENLFARQFACNDLSEYRRHIYFFSMARWYALIASSLVFQIEMNRPLWQKTAPSIPDAFCRSLSCSPAQLSGSG